MNSQDWRVSKSMLASSQMNQLKFLVWPISMLTCKELFAQRHPHLMKKKEIDWRCQEKTAISLQHLNQQQMDHQTTWVVKMEVPTARRKHLITQRRCMTDGSNQTQSYHWLTRKTYSKNIQYLIMGRRKCLTTSTTQNLRRPAIWDSDHSKRLSSWRTTSRSQRNLNPCHRKFPSQFRAWTTRVASFSMKSIGNMVSRRFSISTPGRTTRWRLCSSQLAFSIDISIWSAGEISQAHRACILLWHVYWCRPSWNSQFLHLLPGWSIVCLRMNENM